MGEQIRKKIVAWDIAPEKEYFEHLFRVSQNQIIWGGNYFELPPTRCFLVWRKLTISDSFSMAMAEYAWTSFFGNAKVFEFPPQGKQGDRYHPTQKPIELYAWIYQHFAKPGDRILDTHLGSGSSRIAAHKAGLDFVGYEIDKEYFDKAEERFRRHTAQERLRFDTEPQNGPGSILSRRAGKSLTKGRKGRRMGERVFIFPGHAPRASVSRAVPGVGVWAAHPPPRAVPGPFGGLF